MKRHSNIIEVSSGLAVIIDKINYVRKSNKEEYDYKKGKNVPQYVIEIATNAVTVQNVVYELESMRDKNYEAIKQMIDDYYEDKNHPNA